MSRATRLIRGSSVRSAARWGALALAVTVLAGTARPAAAQFGLFGQSEASTQDVYDSIATHGFRLVGPLVRNGDVYVADVIDRQRRRERLIISRSDAQIMQRFFVETGGRRNTYGAALPGASDGGIVPRAPLARNDDSSDFFSRIVRGWGDDSPPPRPPAAIDGEAVAPPVLPRLPRITRPRAPDVEPRVATRRDDAPIVAKPLPAPAPVQSAPAAPVQPAPVQAALPVDKPDAAPAAGAPAGPVRATVVNTDPLRIPGVKNADGPKAADAGRPAAPKAAPPKPAAKPDVPVAPLD